MRDDVQLDVLPTYENFAENDNEKNTLKIEDRAEDTEIVLSIVDGGPLIASKNALSVEKYERYKRTLEDYEDYHFAEISLREFIQTVVDLMDVEMEVVSSDMEN